MKKLITILVLLLLPSAQLLTMAQETIVPEEQETGRQKQKDEKVFYKGQAHVSRVLLYRDGQGKVHLEMRVTYSTDLLNRGEKLYVSPQLRDGDERLTFAPMVFDGKSKRWRVRNSDVIVVADEAYGNFHFDIHYVGTYLQWMRGSSLAFLSEEIVSGGVRNHFTDLLFDNLQVPLRSEGEKIQPLVAGSSEPFTQPAPVATQTVPEQAAKPAKAPKEKKVKLAKAPKEKLAKAKSEPETGGRFHLRTNLLYDIALLPNVGLELGVSPKVSVVLNAGGNWIKNDHKHWYWRVLTADVEGRYWLGKRPSYNGFQHRGHHVGIYGAVYRYDIEFGHKGQMGDFAYGAGFSYGYSFPIGHRLSLDMALGVGYIGGKYKEYEPQDDCYVWLADKQRHYFGPTKAEVTLVWHLGK